MTMDRQTHWDEVFSKKDAKQVTWYQPRLERSLDLLRQAGLGTESRVIDVGGGASTLIDDLLLGGVAQVAVLDVSSVALERTAERLGPRGVNVCWIAGDVTRVVLPELGFDLWHDRAVFHFLTDADERRRYVEQLQRVLVAGGHVILATFAEDGPERCSGLPTVRYGPDALMEVLGPAGLELLDTGLEDHKTPWGREQRFRYFLLRRVDG